MQDKEFKTHKELIQLLESRGLSVPDSNSKSTIKMLLQRIGYYRLINGYAPLFYIPGQKDSFRPGTTIHEIHALYEFDNSLRSLFLEYILPFESNVKALIAYEFPKNHRESSYLTFKNFDVTQKDASQKIATLLSNIQRQIADRSSDPSISHYLTRYGYIPLWVLNNILSFGIISKFYSLMQQPERQSVAKTFKLQDSELANILTCISSVRNLCAHGNRLYCYRSKRPLSDTNLHKQMGIEKAEKGEYLIGKRDLFSVMIALKLVLSGSTYRSFLSELDKAICSLDSQLSTINSQDVLDEMGFPSDWKKLLSISKKKANLQEH